MVSDSSSNNGNLLLLCKQLGQGVEKMSDNQQQSNQQNNGLSPDEVAAILQNGLEPTMRLVREGAENKDKRINFHKRCIYKDL